MKVRVKKLVPEAVIPQKAHATDAGLDLVAVSCKREYECVVYGTGLAFEIPAGYMGLVFPRSSVYKQDLILSNCVGIVDSGYRGEVLLKFKITNPRDFRSVLYDVGDRVGQIVIVPYPEIEFEEADELEFGERGANGYGSTGK